MVSSVDYNAMKKRGRKDLVGDPVFTDITAFTDAIF
jgi:hypothetical protein